ncbi:MAG: outer membrane lipoprotein carrier protein LolA [Alphaproteobacteria bacterium]|nr:outer membrane lipoprotein carrier protein LolA [Alphaproteobacteria bacterium]
MRRAARALLAVCLSTLLGAPAAAESEAAESESELIQRVEAYFDGVTTLESRFIQTNPDGAYVDGVIRLQRPGRMRIEYAPEAGLEVIANGAFFILVDHRLEEATYLPLEATPAHLLLREDFRLGEEISVLGVDRGAGLVRLALARKGEEAAGTVTVTLNADPLQLRQWIVEDAQGQRTRVTLLDPRFGLVFDPDLFTFDNPYGRRPGGGN